MEKSGPPAEKPGSPVRTGRPSRSSADLAARATSELLGLHEKIRALEAGAIERRKSGAERLADLAAEKKPLERAVAKLEEIVARREKELRSKQEALAAREKEAAKLKSELDACAEPVKPFLTRVEEMASGGIPWRQEARRQAIAAAREAIAAPGASSAAALRAASRIATEEEALGRAVEEGTVEVEVEGQVVGVQAFHLGGLAVFFADADGSLSGFVLPGQKLEEGIEAVRGKPGAAAGYLLALEVLSRQRPPRLVPLTLPSLPREAEEGK